jgi:hypothetical protein
MAHSYVEAFPTERDAFVAMATDFPDRTAFLVDTYDTINGVETAIDVAAGLGRRDHLAVRIDSGDLLDLSTRTRAILDAAGHSDATIIVSGGLDEFDVERLLDAGAPIDTFGVGTRIGVSADAPSLETVYKLVEYAGQPTMKLSEGEQSMPGAKQVYRSSTVVDDVLAQRSEPAPAGTEPLLFQVMSDGKRTGRPDEISNASDRLAADLARLPETARVRNHGAEGSRVRSTAATDREVADEHRGAVASGDLRRPGIAEQCMLRRRRRRGTAPSANSSGRIRRLIDWLSIVRCSPRASTTGQLSFGRHPARQHGVDVRRADRTCGPWCG